jgi:hypothetical protein
MASSEMSDEAIFTRVFVAQAAIEVGLAKRLRATKAAAAAPNSNTIGGAGTGAG